MEHKQTADKYDVAEGDDHAENEKEIQLGLTDEAGRTVTALYEDQEAKR